MQVMSQKGEKAISRVLLQVSHQQHFKSKVLQASKCVLYFILFDKIRAGYVTEGGEGNISMSSAGQP
jgi:hypothetical protein